MDNPRIFWVPSISPSSIIFYTGDQFPAWKNNLFVGALNGQQLQRIAFNQPSQAERREPLLTQLRIRVRDVQQGSNGNIYVATEKRTGGADPHYGDFRNAPRLTEADIKTLAAWADNGAVEGDARD